jgi:hypothetical protein
MSKAQMTDDFSGVHVRQLLTTYVFLQSIPHHHQLPVKVVGNRLQEYVCSE